MEQHWPRELEMVVFDNSCVANSHQTMPTVDHVLFAHSHRYYNLPFHNIIVYTCSLCKYGRDQQAHKVCVHECVSSGEFS